MKGSATNGPGPSKTGPRAGRSPSTPGIVRIVTTQRFGAAFYTNRASWPALREAVLAAERAGFAYRTGAKSARVSLAV